MISLSLSVTSGLVLFNLDGSDHDFTSPSVGQKMTTENSQKTIDFL